VPPFFRPPQVHTTPTGTAFSQSFSVPLHVDNDGVARPFTVPGMPNLSVNGGDVTGAVQNPTAATGTVPPSAPLPWQEFFAQGPGAPPRERRKWTVPDGRGATIRQQVEKKEREVGLRCHDPSCGLAPTDDVPLVSEKDTERIVIRKNHDGAGGDHLRSHACDHKFHSGCLVSAARVAGLSPSLDSPSDEVEVSCMVCRAQGHVGRCDWDSGVKQLVDYQ